MKAPVSLARTSRARRLAVALVVWCLIAFPSLAFAASVPAFGEADAIRSARVIIAANGADEPEYVSGLQGVARKRVVEGRAFWVVDLRDADGTVQHRIAVSDPHGMEVRQPALLKRLGAWDAFLLRHGFLGSWTWAIIGLLAAVGAAAGSYFWIRRPRLGWWAWIVNNVLFVTLAAFGSGILISLDIGDTRGAAVAGISTAVIVAGLLLGRRKRKGRFALVELPAEIASGAAVVSQDRPVDSAAVPVVMPGGKGKAAAPSSQVDLRVVPPEKLPSFADVGGADEVKAQLRETVGMLVSHADLVERYGIDWNGVLLYGPPGCGKTFIAKATAGEYGMNFIDVRVSDVISRWSGESTKLVAEVFQKAAAYRPCILFFDEFDSVAQRRQDAAWDTESTRVVNQLLRELESVRDTPDLVVMAATNHKDTLDEAVIRPGRFDRHIQIGLPDETARRMIFDAQLDERPIADGIGWDELVARTDGMSAADIAAVVDYAAIEAVRLSVASDRKGQREDTPISHELLLGAIDDLRAKVRPSVAITSWDDIVLDDETRRKLQDLQHQIENHEELALRGLEIPRGILLYGPPGTGKTTIARVLASQTDASFFSADASELVSMWLGETQKRISRLFDEARRHRPSIVFIDEIDSLVPKRDGSGTVEDDITSQFLREIDGIESSKGVFVVAATNMPDALDPALLRGGRLSRQILIPLPDLAEREALFRVHSRRMKLADGVDFKTLAEKTDGSSGADINEICDAAGMEAYRRSSEVVGADDFEKARSSYRADRRVGGRADAPTSVESRKKVRIGLVPPPEQVRDASTDTGPSEPAATGSDG